MLQYRNYNEVKGHNTPKLSLQRADKRLSFLSEQGKNMSVFQFIKNEVEKQILYTYKKKIWRS